MKNLSISIENPCHEDWQQMTPESQGRFCQTCEKTVVDFSKMSDEEVLNYFSRPRTQKICGRFREDQLVSASRAPLPQNTTHGKPSRQLLNFAYLLVLLFGVGLSSCDSHKSMGEINEIKVEEPHPSNKKEIVELMGDTTVVNLEDSPKPLPSQPTPQKDTYKLKDTQKKDTFIKLGKPKIRKIETISEEVKIMGECVIPYEYND